MLKQFECKQDESVTHERKNKARILRYAQNDINVSFFVMQVVTFMDDCDELYCLVLPFPLESGKTKTTDTEESNNRNGVK